MTKTPLVAAVCLALALPASAAALEQYDVDEIPTDDYFATHAAAGDLNGDGRPDLVGLEFRPGRALPLLQDADGGFGPGTPLDVVADPQYAAIGDLNDDGRADIAVAGGESADVTILFQRAGGGFDREDVEVGSGLRGLAVLDANDDGREDLALLRNDFEAPATTGSVKLLQQDGTGGFERESVDVGRRPFNLAAGDVNGDGDTDLVVPNSGDDDVSILTQDGSTLERSDVAAGSLPRHVAIGDLTGDGRTDIAVTVASETGFDTPIATLIQRPGGGYQRRDVPGQGFVDELAIADADGDGDGDLHFNDDNSTGFLLQEGGFEFERLTVAVNRSIALADLLGNDLPEIVSFEAINESESVIVLRSNGDPLPDCDGREPNFVGTTRGNERIEVPSGRNVAVGLDGEDLISMDPGKTVACGNDGKDGLSVRMDGGSVATMLGGDGADKLLGGVRDRSDGGKGDDVVAGGHRDDLLFGGSGEDLVQGGDGDDRMRGESGDDDLKGFKGRDEADGGSGRDTCRAEAKRSCER